jgi:hypothetical protein
VQNASNLARAGRGARIGTKAGRIARVVRLARLVRIVKLYKNSAKLASNYNKDDEFAKLIAKRTSYS